MNMMYKKGRISLNKMIRTKYFLMLIVLILILLAIGTNPLAFQKSNSIIRSAGVKRLEHSKNSLDVAAFLRQIPYSDESMVYDVNPVDKYNKTIVQGIGNCSNMVFGAAYYLLEKHIPFQIIHLLPEEDFLQGEGHSVLRVPYQLNGEKRIGIVDVMEGGIPMEDGDFLHLSDLAHPPLKQFSINYLNYSQDHADDDLSAYNDTRMITGYIPDDEVARYFTFIEKIYIPLGSKKLEKYVYDGMSMLLGYYPKIHVVKYDQLYQHHNVTRLFYSMLLELLRITIVLILIFIITDIGKTILSRFKNTLKQNKHSYS